LRTSCPFQPAFPGLRQSVYLHLTGSLSAGMGEYRAQQDREEGLM